MVQLSLQVTIAPDRVRETIQALRVILRPASLDRGCAGTRLSAGVENPTILFYTEDWVTPEALNHQLQSTRFARLLEIMETSTVVPTLEIRFISEVRGLEYVEAECAR
jgi:quinol monooxygenase YgiN